MKRSVFLAGSIMLVVGFILYQFGFSYELHQTTLLARWLAQLANPIIQRGLSLEGAAIILQFTGGLLTIFGIIICFAGVAGHSKASLMSRSVKPVETGTESDTTNCRFCGARIEEGSSFCSKCNKSQT